MASKKIDTELLNKVNKAKNDEMTRCLQRRVDSFKFTLNALKAMPSDGDEFVELIDGFETATGFFKNDHDLIAAYWYLRGAAETLDISMSELLEDCDLSPV